MANDAQREAAKDAVIQAARELAQLLGAIDRGEITWQSATPCQVDLEQALCFSVRNLDALQAEPELPPRGVVWREMMARVDHEGGC